ncbi:hypothetical protein [uncultured Roseibium sp.]|uniref:hypothetical protein n=1 Tax=uncultured Roseibium sp. TaxID=1936171 RepID=UPI003216D8BD
MTAEDITIELGSDPSGGCPCCDPEACYPQGYVTRGGQPHAIYFADWDYGASGAVELLISVGNWEKDSKPADRCAAAFRGRLADGVTRWTGFDAGLSLWRDVGMVGQLLTDEEAAREPDFRQLAEAIAAGDARVQKALSETEGTSKAMLRPVHRSGGSFAAQAAPKQSEPD